MKIEIKSDGTVSGTQVKVDGVTITETSNIVGVDFSASCVYSDGYTDFSYLMREGTGKDTKLTRKSFSQRKDDTSTYGDEGANKSKPSVGKAISEDDEKILLTTLKLVGDSFGKYCAKTSNISKLDPRVINDMIKAGVINTILDDSEDGKENKEDKTGDESG